MSKLIDTTLLNARIAERDSVVQDGVTSERLESQGKTFESLKSDAKKVLGLGEDAIIELEWQSILTKHNVQTSAFIALASFTSKAEETNFLTSEELSGIKEVESKLALLICERYDMELEELYSEEE